MSLVQALEILTFIVFGEVITTPKTNKELWHLIALLQSTNGDRQRNVPIASPAPLRTSPVSPCRSRSRRGEWPWVDCQPSRSSAVSPERIWSTSSRLGWLSGRLDTGHP